MNKGSGRSKIAVTVVIPCFNLGKYLDETVQSVLSQAYPDFEIIIVDDGSTDRATKRKLAHYSAPKTRVIRTANRGLPSARNTGIAAAAGKYICCLDADDILHTEFLDKSVQVLEQDKKNRIGFVGIGVRKFGALNETVRVSGTKPWEMIIRNRFVCSCLFRKAAWKRVGGYDTTLTKGYEDWDFWLSLMEEGYDFATLPDVLFSYRIRRGSMLQSSRSHHENVARAIRAKHKKLIARYSDQLIEELLSGNRHESTSGSLLIEAYVRTLWAWLGRGGNKGRPMKIALFGAGRHTQWLLGAVSGIPGPKVVAILDDNPKPGPLPQEIPLIIPSVFKAGACDAILISSDTSVSHQMARRCRDIYGKSVRLVMPYDGMTNDPFAKPATPSALPRWLSFAEARKP